MRMDFKYLRHVNGEQWHEMQIYVYVPSEKFSTYRVKMVSEISGEINGGVKPLSAVLWNQHQMYNRHGISLLRSRGVSHCRQTILGLNAIKYLI